MPTIFVAGKRVSFAYANGTAPLRLYGTLVDKTGSNPKVWWVKVDGSRQNYFPSPILCHEDELTVEIANASGAQVQQGSEGFG
jgi:hypothetical protein